MISSLRRFPVQRNKPHIYYNSLSKEWRVCRIFKYTTSDCLALDFVNKLNRILELKRKQTEAYLSLLDYYSPQNNT